MHESVSCFPKKSLQNVPDVFFPKILLIRFGGRWGRFGWSTRGPQSPGLPLGLGADGRQAGCQVCVRLGGRQAGAEPCACTGPWGLWLVAWYNGRSFRVRWRSLSSLLDAEREWSSPRVLEWGERSCSRRSTSQPWRPVRTPRTYKQIDDVRS